MSTTSFTPTRCITPQRTVKDTCPYCRVVGDFYGVPEFVPAQVRCGNCRGVYLYTPSRWERLVREPYEGQANEVYLRPRWRPDRAPPALTRDVRAEARALLQRYYVKQLVWMLRGTYRWDYEGTVTWQDIKAVLATKPHVEFDRRKSSARRQALAKRNHGCRKNKNR